MNQVRAGALDARDFFAQAREVGGEHRRRDFVLSLHAHKIASRGPRREIPRTSQSVAGGSGGAGDAASLGRRAARRGTASNHIAQVEARRRIVVDEFQKARAPLYQQGLELIVLRRCERQHLGHPIEQRTINHDRDERRAEFAGASGHRTVVEAMMALGGDLVELGLLRGSENRVKALAEVALDIGKVGLEGLDPRLQIGEPGAHFFGDIRPLPQKTLRAQSDGNDDAGIRPARAAPRTRPSAESAVAGTGGCVRVHTPISNPLTNRNTVMMIVWRRSLMGSLPARRFDSWCWTIAQGLRG